MTRTRLLLAIVAIAAAPVSALAGNPATGDGVTLRIWVATETETYLGDTVNVYHGKDIGIYYECTCETRTVVWGTGGVNAGCFDHTEPTAPPGDVSVYTVTATASWPAGSEKQDIVATLELRVNPFVEITAPDVVGEEQTKDMAATFSPPLPKPEGWTVTWWSSDPTKASVQQTGDDATVTGVVVDETVTVYCTYYGPPGGEGLECTADKEVDVTSCFVKDITAQCSHRENPVSIKDSGYLFEVVAGLDNQDSVTLKVSPFNWNKYCQAHPYWTNYGRKMQIDLTEAPLWSPPLPPFVFRSPSAEELEYTDCTLDPEVQKVTINRYAPHKWTGKWVFQPIENIGRVVKYLEKVPLLRCLCQEASLRVEGGVSNGFYEEPASPSVKYRLTVFGGVAGVLESKPIPLPIRPAGIPVKAQVRAIGNARVKVYRDGDSVTANGSVGAKLAIRVFAEVSANFKVVKATVKAGGEVSGGIQNGQFQAVANQLKVKGDYFLGQLAMFVIAETKSPFCKFKYHGEYVIWNGYTWPFEWTVYSF